MSPPTADTDHARPPVLIGVLLGILLGAMVLRGWALTDDLWFDEVWNWSRLRYVGDVLDILLKDELRHDNNHLLITLWMFVAGDQDQGVVYRLPSLAAGLVTLWLVIDPRRGIPAVVFPGVMFAVSFWMVLFSTEARGYALSVCLALGAYRLLADGEAGGFRLGPGRACAYWVLVTAAIAAHLIAIHVLLGAIAWTGIRLARDRALWPAVRRLAWLHGIPVLFVSVLWLVFVRKMTIGGATDLPVAWTLQNLCAWTTGAPNVALVAWPAMALIHALAAFELRRRAAEGSLEWVLLPVVLVVAPLLTLATASHIVLYARFFLMGAMFALLYAARGLVRLHGGPGAGWTRTLAVVVLVLFVAGNLVRDVRFVRGGGRGHYRAAVEHMARASGPEFWVGGDFDLRNGVLLLYHRRGTRPGQTLRYLGNAPQHPRGTDWFVTHTVWSPESQWEEAPPEATIRMRGAVYDLTAVFPHYGPSGFTWHVYQRR